MEDSLELDLDQNKNLAQSVSFGPNFKPNMLNSEVPDVPDYIDDFLQISPDAVFINDITKTAPKTKKVKKIIKKKIIKTKTNNKVKENKNNQLKKDEKEKEKEKISKNINKGRKVEENKIKNNKKIDGKNIKQESEEDKEKRLISYNKIHSMMKSKIIFELLNAFKFVYIFKKMKNCQINSAKKISNAYRGYFIRQNLKLNYLTKKILKFRDLCASKIIAHYKGYKIRKISKIKRWEI